MIAFGPYRLDLDEERLWKGDKLLALRRKPFSILRYLAQHPKRLVTQQELLAEVWSGAVVSESAVRSHLHELRQVLGEGVIETVIGRGYRFVAELATEPSRPAPVQRPRIERPERLVVGREAELQTLRQMFERAATGHRQTCFVSGDAGIGKTTLVDTFLDELEDRGVLAVRGQSIEQFGTPEAYLAMIDVIGKLRRSERGDAILAALARYAPTFLASVPHLVPDELLADVNRRAQGGSESRMVRELVEALEVSCTQDPIVIVLEDLQWSDLATIDLIAVLAQRTERAKLMLVGTSRRAAIQTADNPLSRVVKTLTARSGAVSIALDRIDVERVRELVAKRFPGHAFPPRLIDVIATITGGTPLFLVTLLDDLVSRGMVAREGDGWTLTVSVDEVAAHRPDTIKQLIDIQLDRLSSEEQRTLEAASVVGAEFDTGSVAAALGVAVEDIDDRCDDLTRRGLFLRRVASEELPDGSLVSRYAMTHSLVQEVCEERGSAARRQRWHLGIADYLERAYAGATHTIAQVLATHTEKAGATARAVQHHMVAGQVMALRFASADAVASFERARALMQRLPRTPERDNRELKLLAVIGQLLVRTRYNGGDPLNVYERALELAREIGDVTAEYAGLANLALRHAIHADLDVAARIAEDIVAAEAKHTLDPALVEYGTNVRGFIAIYRGEVKHALQLLGGLLEPRARTRAVAPSVVHPTAMLGAFVRTAVSLAYSSLGHLMTGAPDRALCAAQEGVAEARTLDDRIALGITENALARIHLERRDPVDVVEQAARVVVDRGTAGWFALDECRRVIAWAEAHRTPLTAAEAAAAVDGFRARLAMRSLSATHVAGVVADMLRVSGHLAEARTVIELALPYGEECAERLFAADLLRLRGDCLPAGPEASAAYRQAYERATAMEMPLVALRAATRLRDAALVRASLDRCVEPDATTPDFVDARAQLS